MARVKNPSGNTFASLSKMTGTSAVVGIIITALAVPFLAVTTVAASATIRDFDGLPSFSELGTQPQQNYILAKDGDKEVTIATVYSQNRQEIAWSDVTPQLKNAVLAAEDRRFYEHGGIDVQGIIRAGVTDILTHSSQGASTLTQQTIKNFCIAEAFKNYPDQATDDAVFAQYKTAVEACNETTLDRKIREMKYAIQLEKQYSKDEILLAYLNIANYGGTVYGIQSAAERYYGVDAKNLTVVQAASLIAIVQQPGARRLDVPANYPANTARRNSIVNNMFSYGYIDAATRDASLAVVEGSKNDNLSITEPKNGCSAANSLAKQFCDYVVQNVKNYTALGATPADRLNNWRIGGYTLHTTIDLTLQKTAQDAVRQYAPNNETILDLGASATTVEENTGRILTMAQNKTFDDTGNGNKKTSTAVNFNTDQDVGGSIGFQVGSTYKVFTLINWLEHGHGLNEVVQANARTVNQADFTDTCNGPWGGTYPFRNDAGTAPYVSVRQATIQSINGAYITMAMALDLCDTKKIAQSLGIHLAGGAKDGSDLATNPASVLGVNTIAPLSVAAAYAGIANKGKFCTPVAVDKITDSTGKDLGGQVTTCTQAIPEDVAVATESALGSAMGSYASNPHDGTALIGKTGTTNGAVQTWVTGASTKAATSIWYGNIKGSYSIRSYYGGGTFPGNQRHLILKTILTEQDKRYKGGTFDTPQQSFITGITVATPDLSGLSEKDARALALSKGFTVADKTSDVASDLPKGQVAKQVPAAGLRVSKGSEITLSLSDASEAAIPDVSNTDVAAATAALNALGFTKIAPTCVALGSPDPVTGLMPDGSAPRPDGTVIAQTPSVGSVKSISKTTIKLSVGYAVCP